MHIAAARISLQVLTYCSTMASKVCYYYGQRSSARILLLLDDTVDLKRQQNRNATNTRGGADSALYNAQNNSKISNASSSFSPQYLVPI